MFVALKFEAGPTPGQPASSVTVHLDAHRRLLLHVSASEGSIEKKSPDLAHVFQMLHEVASDGDRIVLVANPDPATRPADRGDAD